MNSSDKPPDDSIVTRRGFCTGVLMGSAALIAASSHDVLGASQKVSLPSYLPVKIEGAEAMRPGSFLLFAYPNRADGAILVRTTDGNYYAHGQRCSHLGCFVNFNREQKRFECPCHSGAYDLRNGSVLHGPPRRPLDHIFLEMRGGEVWAVGRTNDNDAFLNIAS